MIHLFPFGSVGSNPADVVPDIPIDFLATVKSHNFANSLPTAIEPTMARVFYSEI